MVSKDCEIVLKLDSHRNPTDFVYGARPVSKRYFNERLYN